MFSCKNTEEIEESKDNVEQNKQLMKVLKAQSEFSETELREEMANCKAIRIPKSWAYYLTKAMKKIACYVKPQTPCVNLEKDSTMDCDSQLEQNTEKKEQIMGDASERKSGVSNYWTSSILKDLEG